MQRFTVAVLASVCFAIAAPASAQTLSCNGPFAYLRNICTGGSAANVTPQPSTSSKSSKSSKSSNSSTSSTSSKSSNSGQNNHNKNNHNGDKNGTKTPVTG